MATKMEVISGSEGLLSEPSSQGLLLRLLSGPKKGSLLRVRDGACIIGSDASAMLRLRAPGIAEKHCEIVQSEKGALVRSLHGPVLVNGASVLESEITTADEVQVGPLAFALAKPKEATPPAAGEKYPLSAPLSATGYVPSPREAASAIHSLAPSRREVRRMANRRTRRVVTKLKQAQHELRMEKGRGQALAGQQERQGKQLSTLEHTLLQLREQNLLLQRELACKDQEQSQANLRLREELDVLREESASNSERLAFALQEQQRLQSEHQQKLNLMACEYSERQADYERLRTEAAASEKARLDAEQQALQAQRELEKLSDQFQSELQRGKQELEQAKHALAEERQSLEKDRQEALLAAEHARRDCEAAETLRLECQFKERELLAQQESARATLLAEEERRSRELNDLEQRFQNLQSLQNEWKERESQLLTERQYLEQSRAEIRAERLALQRQLDQERSAIAEQSELLMANMARQEEREVALREKEMRWTASSTLEGLSGSGENIGEHGQHASLEAARQALSLERLEFERERSAWLAAKGQADAAASEEVPLCTGMTLEWNREEVSDAESEQIRQELQLERQRSEKLIQDISTLQKQLEEMRSQVVERPAQSSPDEQALEELAAEFEARAQQWERDRELAAATLLEREKELEDQAAALRGQAEALEAARSASQFSAGDGNTPTQEALAQFESDKAAFELERRELDRQKGASVLCLNELHLEIEQKREEIRQLDALLAESQNQAIQASSSFERQDVSPEDLQQALLEFEARVREWELAKEQDELRLNAERAEVAEWKQKLEASAAELLSAQESRFEKQAAVENAYEDVEQASASQWSMESSRQEDPNYEDQAAAEFQSLEQPQAYQVEHDRDEEQYRDVGQYGDAEQDSVGARLSGEERLAAIVNRAQAYENDDSDSSSLSSVTGKTRLSINWSDDEGEDEDAADEESPRPHVEDYFDRAAREARERAEQRSEYKPPDILATLQAMREEIAQTSESDDDLQEPENSIADRYASSGIHSDTVKHAEPEDDGEHAVREYMQQLMERSGSKSKESEPSKTEEPITLVRETKTRPTYQRRAAPESAPSLQAMRQIANQTSTTALQTHAHRTARNGIITKAVLATFCTVASVIMLLYVKGWLRFCGAAMAAGITGFCIYDLVALSRKLKAITDAAKIKPLSSTEEANSDSQPVAAIHLSDVGSLEGMSDENLEQSPEKHEDSLQTGFRKHEADLQELAMAVQEESGDVSALREEWRKEIDSLRQSLGQS